MTLQLAKKAKYMKGKFMKSEDKFTIESDGELEGGKEALEKRVKEAAEKKGKFGAGVFAHIITKGEGDKARVIEIRVMPAFKGKFKKKDAN
jgi:hypothetical protein